MSLSDDDKNKLNYKICIENCLKIAEQHAKYCKENCFSTIAYDYKFYPHDEYCINFAKKHHNSFVECDSLFCFKYCIDNNVVPSYKKEKKKLKAITELTFYD